MNDNEDYLALFDSHERYRRDAEIAGDKLREVIQQRDELLELLRRLRWNLHRAWPTTAGPPGSGGIGGQAITPACQFNHPETDEDFELAQHLETRLAWYETELLK